jgi:putative ABC transport system substrate-binding protein
MRRRDFISVLGGAALTWPLSARAQQGGRVRWIGVLMIPPDDDQFARESTTVFEESLAKLAWTVGRNLAIDYRWGVNDPEKARSVVAQILRLSPDLILTDGSSALAAAQQATGAVPIVFTRISEPVERGLVASLARPGGNTTGFTNLEATIGGKWLELLQEIAPQLRRVIVIFNPASSFAARFFASAEAATAIPNVASHVHNAAEIDAAVTAFAREPGVGLMLPPDGFTSGYRRQILDLTARYRLPAISTDRSFAAEGGLIAYGPDQLDAFRRAATYVDRILKGEKPADLPVQAPVKYQLVINLKTTRALGLTVPDLLLALAEEVVD